MSNDLLQQILVELRDMRESQQVMQSTIEDHGKILVSMDNRLTSVEDRLTSVDNRLTSVEESQVRIESKLDLVYGQTVSLTEFKTDTSQKLNKIHDEILFTARKERQNEKDITMIKEHLQMI